MSTYVEKFYRGQYLTFTDKGLVDPTNVSAVVGWDVQQYEPGYYSLGDAIQLQSSITCDACWENVYATFAVKFFANGRQVGETQWVQRGGNATPPTPPPSINPHKYFDGWDPDFHNITKDTNCIAKYNEMPSAYFMIKCGDLAPILSGCDVYMPNARVEYPPPSAVQYYTYKSASPESVLQIKETTTITYNYLSNQFNVVGSQTTYNYDGEKHGLQLTVTMNNHPGQAVTISYSESEDGPWAPVSPTVRDQNKTKYVFYKLEYDNYQTYVGRETIRIGAACKITLNYKIENGDDAQSSYDALYGKIFTVPSDIKTRYTGYTLTGWNPPNILDNPITADQFLTAQYDSKSYTCHFYNEDKTEWIKKDGSYPTSIVKYSEKFDVPNAYDTTKEIDPRHYIFSGWYDYYNGAPVDTDIDSATRDLSAVAHYHHVSYLSVYIQANTTYFHRDYQEDYGKIIIPAIDLELPKIANYTFSHFEPNESAWCEMTADAEVTAVYESQVRTAVFHANWAGAPLEQTSFTGTVGTLFDETPFKLFEDNRIGYEISSWNTDAYGVGDTIGKGSFYLVKNDDYWAQWNHIIYYVWFYTEDGTINSGEITSYYYGETKTLPTDVTKPGNEFLGWKDETKQYVTQILPTDIGDKTFIASWNPQTYRVTFNPNGGKTPSPTYIDVTYGQMVDSLATCTRTGYALDGWYTAAEGGTKITVPYEAKITADTTLYAHWTKA